MTRAKVATIRDHFMRSCDDLDGPTPYTAGTGTQIPTLVLEKDAQLDTVVTELARTGFTRFAGYLAAAQYGFVAPQMLGWHLSATVLVMVVLGGLRSVTGPLVGAWADAHAAKKVLLFVTTIGCVLFTAPAFGSKLPWRGLRSAVYTRPSEPRTTGAGRPP